MYLKALIALWKVNALPAILSILGVIAGVAGIVVVLALGEGAEQEVRSTMREMGVGTIILKNREDNSIGLDLEDVRRLKGRYSHLYEAVSAIRHKDHIVFGGSKEIQFRVVGTDSYYPAVFPVRVRQGRFLTPLDLNTNSSVCILGSHAHNEFYPGSNTLGNRVRIGKKWCRIVGILEPASLPNIELDRFAFPDIDRTIYLPLSTYSSGFDDVAAVDQIILRFNDGINLNDAAASVMKTVRSNHSSAFNPVQIVPVELLRQQSELRGIFEKVIGICALLLVLVGGAGIMNTLLLSVSNRKPEIGLRRALGATRLNIAMQFMLEGLFISGMGGVAGVGTGVVIGHIVSNQYGWAVSVNPETALWGFLVSLFAGILFSGYPSLRASLVTPLQALRAP